VTQLERIGYGPFFAAQLELLNQQNFVAARVAADARENFPILGARAAFAEPSGRLRLAIEEGHAPRPAVGDWLAVSESDNLATIHHVLDRRTCLRRRAAGTDGNLQIIAANVDVYFIVTAVGRDFNPRRLERYLTAVWDSGASPVLVLNKCDLAESVEPLIRAIGEVAPAVPTVCVSATTGNGVDTLQAYLQPGTTGAFIGSSGVGKSSLMNLLCGDTRQQTSPVGPEGKGRHTTSRRELVTLPNGGVLIDTPGLREFGLAEVGHGLDVVFADVLKVAADCHFADCTHTNEPDCAVTLAVAEGVLPSARLQSYLRLRAEAEAAELRRSPQQAGNSKKRWKSIHKSAKTLYKITGKWK
jgi:ribosome biogenesis GTPase / thiamine phosphate phosphatase